MLTSSCAGGILKSVDGSAEKDRMMLAAWQRENV